MGLLVSVCQVELELSQYSESLFLKRLLKSQAADIAVTNKILSLVLVYHRVPNHSRILELGPQQK